MRRLHEPHIVKLRDFLEDNDNFYIVLEYCDIGDIISLQTKQPNRVFKLNSASEYLSQVLFSLESLHSRGYMHGEINLKNVLAKNEDGRQVSLIR
jgi:serine/threonine protein kinase